MTVTVKLWIVEPTSPSVLASSENRSLTPSDASDGSATTAATTTTTRAINASTNASAIMDRSPRAGGKEPESRRFRDYDGAQITLSASLPLPVPPATGKPIITKSYACVCLVFVVSHCDVPRSAIPGIIHIPVCMWTMDTKY